MILVVDDDKNIRLSLKLILERNGYEVALAEVPCILMTAWGSIDLAVQGMRAGAFDFITKPWDNGVPSYPSTCPCDYQKVWPIQ